VLNGVESRYIKVIASASPVVRRSRDCISSKWWAAWITFSSKDIFDNDDPSKYSGLQLPSYILVCLAKGQSQEQIASRFPEDGELVGLWVSFLRRNHWAEKVDGRFSITPKGQAWIDKYERK
jgi:hypothetical protein